MIRALIFDIGNVLVKFDFNLAITKLLPLCDPSIGGSLQRIEAIKNDYESGKISRADFLAQVFALVKFRGSEEFFVKAWQEIFEENQPMTRFVESVRGRYPLYLLSNTSDIHMDYILAEYPIFGCFTDAIYSYEVQCAKPEDKIFELAATRFALKPEETLFIDDLEANILSAERVGFKTIRYDFRDHAAFEAAVQAHGISLEC